MGWKFLTGGVPGPNRLYNTGSMPSANVIATNLQFSLVPTVNNRAHQQQIFIWVRKQNSQGPGHDQKLNWLKPQQQQPPNMNCATKPQQFFKKTRIKTFLIQPMMLRKRQWNRKYLCYLNDKAHKLSTNTINWDKTKFPCLWHLKNSPWDKKLGKCTIQGRPTCQNPSTTRAPKRTLFLLL